MAKRTPPSAQTVYGRFLRERGYYHNHLKDTDCWKLRRFMFGSGFQPDVAIEGSMVRDESLYESVDESHTLIANMCGAVVEDFVNMEVKWPSFDVAAPFKSRGRRKKEDEPIEDIKAFSRGDLPQVVKEFARGHWENSGGLRIFKTKAWQKHTYGDVFLVSLPDPDANRFYSRVFERANCYATYDARYQHVITSLFVCWQEYPDVIADIVPESAWTPNKKQGDQPVEMLMWLSPHYWMLFIGSTLVYSLSHNWGSVPAVNEANITSPAGVGGVSDVAGVIGINAELNKTISLYHELLANHTRTALHLVAKKWPEWRIIEGQLVFMSKPGEGDQMNLLKLSNGDLPSLTQAMNFYLQLMGRITGWNAGRSGDIKGSFINESSISALTRRLGDNIDVHLNVRGEIERQHMAQVIEQTRVTFPKRPISVYSDTDGQAYELELTGADLATSRVYHNYPPAMFADFEYRTQHIDKMVEKGYYSQETGAAQLGVRNFRQERLKRKKEMREDAEQEIDLRRMVEGFDMAQAEQNPKSKQSYGTSPGLPAGVPEEMVAAEAQRPMPGFVNPESLKGRKTLQEVADAIRAIGAPPVQGRLFLVGRVVVYGATGRLVNVFYTNGDDKQLVLNALPELAAQKRIKFTDMTELGINLPQEPYLEVTPGTEGYEVQGADYQTPAGPEAIDALMEGAPVA